MATYLMKCVEQATSNCLNTHRIQSIKYNDVMDLMHSSEWAYSSFFPFLTTTDLSQLLQVNKSFHFIVKEYGWNNLSIDDEVRELISSLNDVSEKNALLLQTLPSNRKYIIKHISLLQIALKNPLRVMHFLSKLDIELSKISTGGSSIACGENHTVIISSTLNHLDSEKIMKHVPGAGSVYATGSMYRNTIGVPLANIDDPSQSVFQLIKAGPSNYESKFFTSLATSKEHTIALEHGGRAIWIWGGKYNYMNRIPVHMVDEGYDNDLRIIGVCAGYKSFAAILTNHGDVYNTQIESHEDARYRKQSITLRKLNLDNRKVKSIAASGTCFAIIDVNGQVCIFSINQQGNGLVTASNQMLFDIYNENLENFDVNIAMERNERDNEGPLYHALEDTGYGEGKLKIKSISVADRYVGMVTENGQLWIVGSSPLSVGSLSLATATSRGGLGGIQANRVIGELENEKVCQVSCGLLHTLALTETGKVYSWGFNGSGRLGLGHENDMFKPTRINLSPINEAVHVCSDVCETCPKAVNISAGYHHTAIMLENGNVLTFGGAGTDGKLGHGKYSMFSNCCLTPQVMDGFGKRRPLEVTVKMVTNKTMLAFIDTMKLLGPTIIIYLHIRCFLLLFNVFARKYGINIDVLKWLKNKLGN